MSIFSKAIQKHSNQLSSTTDGTRRYKGFLPQMRNHSTQSLNVSERTSLSLSAFYAGVNIVSNHLAGLPIEVIRRDENGNTADLDHHLNEILKHQANSNLNAFQFKKLLNVNSMVYGNGFARIERSGNKISGLYPEKPSETDILQNKNSGDIYYRFKSQDRIYPARDVIHIYQFSLDGITGLSVLEAGAYNSFEGHKALQNFGKKYFDQNATIGGILSTDDSLGNDPDVVAGAKSEVRKEFEQLYTGEDAWFRTAILEGEWNYTQLDIKASDAQLIEAQKATVEDISRWLQIPLSKLSQPDSQSYKSRESEIRQYVEDGLSPRIKIFQQECRNKLFTEREKSQGYKVLIDTKQLIRSNMKETGEFLKSMLDRSVFTINDALDFLDMDTQEGLDVRLMQRNMAILEDVLNGETDADTQTLENLRESINELIENKKSG